MKAVLYFHGGSGNHGCEALARTITSLLDFNEKVIICSHDPDEDRYYMNDRKELEIVKSGVIYPLKHPIGFIVACQSKFLHQKLSWVKPAYRKLLHLADKDTVAYSIGGDNYCYDGKPEVLALLNKELIKRGAKTVLYGCSVEPDLLKDPAVVEDMSRYSLITARESITYNAMKEAGVKTDIMLVPDSAFILPVNEGVLPENFVKGNTIGINISPLILNYGSEKLFEAYCKMVEHIIETTDMQIALVPHVVWEDNNDRLPIEKIYDLFKDTGRVVKVEDCNATQLKWCISQCRMFIGARTHSTIAAYSTCVPTVVIGYSVKSRGIARDLFGTEENYVVSSDSVKSESDLISAFDWLKENEQTMREHLERIMPEYKQKAYSAVDKLKKLHGKA